MSASAAGGRAGASDGGDDAESGEPVEVSGAGAQPVTSTFTVWSVSGPAVTVPLRTSVANPASVATCQVTGTAARQRIPVARRPSG